MDPGAEWSQGTYLLILVLTFVPSGLVIPSALVFIECQEIPPLTPL
jgi:hypothetical protein